MEMWLKCRITFTSTLQDCGVDSRGAAGLAFRVQGALLWSCWLFGSSAVNSQGVDFPQSPSRHCFKAFDWAPERKVMGFHYFTFNILYSSWHTDTLLFFELITCFLEETLSLWLHIMYTCVCECVCCVYTYMCVYIYYIYTGYTYNKGLNLHTILSQLAYALEWQKYCLLVWVHVLHWVLKQTHLSVLCIHSILLRNKRKAGENEHLICGIQIYSISTVNTFL